MTKPGDDRQAAGKVILLGNSAVGKTTLALQLLRGEFLTETEPTVGASCLSQPLQTSRGTVVLNIWDTAGQERFRSVVPYYLRGCQAIVLVCAVDSLESVTSLDDWLSEIDDHVFGDEPVIAVFLNKIDLRDKCENGCDICEMASRWAKSHNFIFTMLSAKDKTAVQNAFTVIAENVARSAQTPRFLIPQLEVAKEKNDSCC